MMAIQKSAPEIAPAADPAQYQEPAAPPPLHATASGACPARLADALQDRL